MARNVFISFRFEDGNKYKTELSELFGKNEDTCDFSEDIDRKNKSEEEIKKILYGKLKRSTVTIILLTPKALEYERNLKGEIDDWIYDEVRYSLEDRENNRTNGLIAVYLPEVKDLLYSKEKHKCDLCDGYITKSLHNYNNLYRLNMLNVKESYKKNKCSGIYDSEYDSYCSLVSYDDFKKDPDYYINIAEEKRSMVEHYDIKVRLQ